MKFQAIGKLACSSWASPLTLSYVPSIMKIIIYSILISCFLSQPIYAETMKDNELIALSVGKIIMYEDECERYGEIGGSPYSSEKHMLLIENEFKKIKKVFPLDQQINFLWSIMTRSNFGSHYSERFTELIYKNCHKEFKAAIDEYLKNGNKKNQTTIHKANFVKNALNLLEAHHAKNSARTN